MSLILDALKKADAERHLGEMPGLHTHWNTSPLPGAVRWIRPPRVVIPMTLLAGVVLLAVIIWQVREIRTVPVPTAPSGSIAPMQEPQSALYRNEQPAPAPAPAPKEAAERGLPASAPAAPAPITVAQVSVPPAVPKAMPKTVLTAKPISPALPEQATRPPVLALSPRSANTQVSDSRGVISLSDLPPAVQQELPPFSITGSMHSPNPADRMLLVGNRMLHEGDEIAPGLIIDSVLPKGATLRFKGYLFKVSH